jgi:hypothetical protein
MRILLILPALALLCACAAEPSERTIQYRASEAAKLEKDLAGFTPGKPQSCVDLRDLNGPSSYGDSTIVYRVSPRLVYRNDVHGSCRGAGDDYILVNQVFGSQLCRGDITRLVDRTSGFYAGSCSMGNFVPYRRDKRG